MPLQWESRTLTVLPSGRVFVVHSDPKHLVATKCLPKSGRRILASCEGIAVEIDEIIFETKTELVAFCDFLANVWNDVLRLTSEELPKTRRVVPQQFVITTPTEGRLAIHAKAVLLLSPAELETILRPLIDRGNELWP